VKIYWYKLICYGMCFGVCSLSMEKALIGRYMVLS